MKYAWIDQHRDRYSVSRLCRVLAVSLPQRLLPMARPRAQSAGSGYYWLAVKISETSRSAEDKK